mmetsp:Transcript_67020/g.216050  ORF Transcript_67020/g.216050 Transcript_67020/m.216050 type:complete len:336 (-) Transcript_67020:2260-3267(-)
MAFDAHGGARAAFSVTGWRCITHRAIELSICAGSIDRLIHWLTGELGALGRAQSAAGTFCRLADTGPDTQLLAHASGRATTPGSAASVRVLHAATLGERGSITWAATGALFLRSRPGWRRACWAAGCSSSPHGPGRGRRRASGPACQAHATVTGGGGEAVREWHRGRDWRAPLLVPWRPWPGLLQRGLARQGAWWLLGARGGGPQGGAVQFAGGAAAGDLRGAGGTCTRAIRGFTPRERASRTAVLGVQGGALRGGLEGTHRHDCGPWGGAGCLHPAATGQGPDAPGCPAAGLCVGSKVDPRPCAHPPALGTHRLAPRCQLTQRPCRWSIGVGLR